MPRPRGLAFAALMLTLALGSASAGASVRFGHPKTLVSGTSTVYTNPKMAVAPDGTASVVWVKSVSEPVPHAWLEFTRIHPDGSVDPTLAFDASSSESLVAPAVAVDRTGRSIVAFRLSGEQVRSVLISAEGTPGQVRKVGVNEFSNLPSEVGFSREGRAYGVFGNYVVGFGLDGVPRAAHLLPGGVSSGRLDMSGEPRVVWRTGTPDYVRGREVLSSPLGPDGTPGVTTRVLPKLPPGGSYRAFDVDGGRILASAVKVNRQKLRRALLLYGRADGRGEPIRLVDAPNPRPKDVTGQVVFGHPKLATGPANRAVAVWTRKVVEGSSRRLNGTLLRGGRMTARVDGSFAGERPKSVAVDFSRSRPVVVAGDSPLFAAQITASGRTPHAAKVPRSRAFHQGNLALAATGDRVRLLWYAFHTSTSHTVAAAHRILTATGRVR